jgi:hypothetical protein
MSNRLLQHAPSLGVTYGRVTKKAGLWETCP